ncbi:MAG: FlgO family outer membrane protein [bacterium]
MKTLTFSCSLVILLLACPGYLFSQGGLDQRVAELSQQIAKEMTEYKKTTIAVVEFSDLQGNVTDFGRFLAEELITRLFQTKKFKVIERQLLNKVITEQKLSLKGLVDPTSAKQLGKLLGVEAIASGTITDLAQSLRVNARLISTETGEIFAVASTKIFKDESVMRLMNMGTTTPTTDRKPASSLTKTKKSVMQKVEANDFTFELKEVKMSGTNLTFKLLITNSGQDRDLTLYSSSRIFDDAGNEYKAQQVRLGNKERSPSVSNQLVSGIPTKAKLSFEKISAQANKIALLEISCWSSGAPSFKVQFRNIPIMK